LSHMRGPERCESEHRPREGLSPEFLSLASLGMKYVPFPKVYEVCFWKRTINSMIIILGFCRPRKCVFYVLNTSDGLLI